MIDDNNIDFVNYLNSQKIGKVIKDYFSDLVVARNQTENEWKTVSDLLAPQIYGFETKSDTATGVKKGKNIFSQSPERAKDDYVGSLASMAFNPLENWVTYNKRGTRRTDTIPLVEKQYLEEATLAVIGSIRSAKSNFYRAVTQALHDFVVLGPMYLCMKRDFITKDINFEYVPVYQLYYQRPERGEINLIYRRYSLTARELLLNYKDSLIDVIKPDNLKKLEQEAKKAERKTYDVIQVVCHKRDMHLGVSLMDMNMHEYKSIYVCPELHTSMRGHENVPAVFKCSGYGYNPYIIAGYKWVDKAAYPIGLGHKVISDIYSYNEQQKQNLIAGNQINMPPMAYMHGTLQNDKLNMSVGALNAIKNTGATLQTGFMKPEPIYTISQLPVTIEMVRESRELIREAFSIDLINDIKLSEMTRGEYDGRATSRLAKLFPMFVNIEQSVQMPVAEFVYDSLKQMKELKEPETLVGKIVPQYSNELHKVYNMMKVGELINGMNAIASISAMPPKVLASIDESKIPLYVFESADLHLGLLKSQEEAQQGIAQAKEDEANSMLSANLNEVGRGVESVAKAQSILGGGL